MDKHDYKLLPRLARTRRKLIMRYKRIRQSLENRGPTMPLDTNHNPLGSDGTFGHTKDTNIGRVVLGDITNSKFGLQVYGSKKDNEVVEEHDSIQNLCSGTPSMAHRGIRRSTIYGSSVEDTFEAFMSTMNASTSCPASGDIKEDYKGYNPVYLYKMGPSKFFVHCIVIHS
ncbi:hypothetical protein PIB30_090227 [Stylosanthes scabra]|uniref:Uncharacterized protein n=1 Tax=Stylosanthes scabra TaxID=79078 RepID=A0ABU6WX19_9FABA|nr:hypothetical protein [Stylosanthes scabra]